MFSFEKRFLVTFFVVCCLRLCSGFFINWGTSHMSEPADLWPSQSQQSQAYMYPAYTQRRYYQPNYGPSYLASNHGGPVPSAKGSPQVTQSVGSQGAGSQSAVNPDVPINVPAIPIQVPLQAQFSPVPNIHNVQLVPCLCPVSQDDIDKMVENNILNLKPQNPQN